MWRGSRIPSLPSKRESTTWVALIWLVPFVGALHHVTLGINRIKRQVAISR